MRRNLMVLTVIAAAVGLVTAALSAVAGSREPEISSLPEVGASSQNAAEPPSASEAEDEAVRRAREHAEMLDREFPLHGLVTKTQIVIRMQPDSEATPIGWLRLGGVVRLRREPQTTATCNSGWYQLHPRGWACAGQGIEVGGTPPAVDRTIAADRTSALPYRYLLVKEPQVPEWHQLPSRDDQRAAAAHGARYVELLTGGDEARAARLRAGELAGEPPPPPEVARWLDRGFYVASNGVEVRSQRRFVRTVRGSYVKESQLEERTGSAFEGVVLEAGRTLPVAWAIRAGRLLRRAQRSDGTLVIEENDTIEPIARLAVLSYLRRERVGDQQYHVVRAPDGTEGLLREWYVTLAEAYEPPRGVGADEPWVHVDLSSQTLVLYRGASPIYATLVSTGLDGHETPVGEFTIRRKMVTDTMADLGPEAGDDRYRIEDVPWTQYFEGSVALHAAFWHGQFGAQRSHGCVNMAPRDAQYVFARTWPEVPEGWHGISTESTGVRGSRVVVTQ